jgi:hypothetical protein
MSRQRRCLSPQSGKQQAKKVVRLAERKNRRAEQMSRQAEQKNRRAGHQ